jgi:hypothetical protein
VSKAPGFRGRELAAFFVLAYAISWVLWLPLVLGQSGLGVLSSRLPIMYVSLGTIGPIAAALVVRRLWDKDWRAFRLWTGWRSLLAGVSSRVRGDAARVLYSCGVDDGIGISALGLGGAVADFGSVSSEPDRRPARRRTRMAGLRSAKAAGSVQSAGFGIDRGVYVGELAPAAIHRALRVGTRRDPE